LNKTQYGKDGCRRRSLTKGNNQASGWAKADLSGITRALINF
jgi:hypothetical protein